MEKQGSSRKTSTSASLTVLKPLTIWMTTNWKILKRDENTRPPYLFLRNLYVGQETTVRTEHGTTDCLTIGKEVCQDCILLYPAYVTYMQSTSCEMKDWMNHKLESRLPGEISITSDTQVTLPF